MNTIIKNEFIEFEKHHRNIHNIYFHIFCGFIFMTFLVSLSKSYSFMFLIFYTFLILFTINDFVITFLIFIILFIMVSRINKYDFSFLSKFVIFIVFYFLSSLSHFLTGEPTILNISKLSVYEVLINTFYFIPFSIFCLMKKYNE